MRTRRIGPVQTAVLMLVSSSPDQAFGSSIVSELSKRAQRKFDDGQIYVALKRLEITGLINSTIDGGASCVQRSRGRPRKMYAITELGMRALADVAQLTSIDQVQA